MNDRVEAEVEDQHRLLAEWLGTPADPALLDELHAAHTDDFTMVTAEGQVLTAPELREAMAGARNARPGLHILISEVTVVAELADTVLAQFLETHVEHGHTSSRRVTALLRADGRARHGLRWRYLHETLLAD